MNVKSNRRSTPEEWRRQLLIELCEPRRLFSTFVVNTLSDAASPGAGLTTLRQAIAQANSDPGPDAITFDPTVFAPGSVHTLTLASGQLKLTDTTGLTTLTGPGASVLTIDANETSRVLRIARGVAANITGITVTGGDVAGTYQVPGRGAGICSAGTVVLDGVTVTRNGKSQNFISGGGILNAGDMTVNNCTISGNGTAESTSDGIYSESFLDVNNCTIDSNAYAGVMNNGTATISGSTIAINDNGVRSAGQLTISNSTISGNSTGIKAQSLAVVDCTITNNSVEGVAAAGTLTVSGSTVSGNGFGGAGGGIYCTTLLMSDSTVSGNSSSGYGGGINAGAVTITASQITGNSVSAPSTFNNAYGGGIFCGDGRISHSVISDNSCQAGNVSNSLDFDNGDAGGGGIDSYGTLTIVRSTISGNSAVGGASPAHTDSFGNGIGGGRAVGGGIVTNGPDSPARGTLNLRFCSIYNNSVTGGVGAASYSYYGVPIGYAAFSGGDAEGGGIFDNNSNMEILNSTIAGNTATGGPGVAGFIPPQFGRGRGGGIFNQSPSAIITNSTVVSNSAVGDQETSYGNDLVDGLANVLLTNSVVGQIHGPVNPQSAYNVISHGGGLANGVNGNQIHVADPMLAPLADNGGPTETMLPLPGSPLIDAGSDALVPAGITTDQRGFSRIYNGVVDIGAVEVQPVARISDAVFNDVNGNGVRDSSDGSLEGWRVYIDSNNDGLYESTEPSVLTDSSGQWAFDNLRLGTYTVRIVPMAGYTTTAPSSDSFTFGVGPGSVRAGNLFGEQAI